MGKNIIDLVAGDKVQVTRKNSEGKERTYYCTSGGVRVNRTNGQMKTRAYELSKGQQFDLACSVEQGSADRVTDPVDGEVWQTK